MILGRKLVVACRCESDPGSCQGSGCRLGGPQRLDQLLHPPGGQPEQVAGRHHRGQCRPLRVRRWGDEKVHPPPVRLPQQLLDRLARARASHGLRQYRIGGAITALFVIERLWTSNLFEDPDDHAISQVSTE